MKRPLNTIAVSLFITAGALVLGSCGNDPVTNLNAASVNPHELAAESRAALKDLYRKNPAARKLGARAKGILVFPEITKGGLMFGGMGGNGALIRPDGTIRDFYQTAGASYGLQAGIQQYGYALFLMDDSAFRNIDRANGWEVGSSPSLVIVDEGMSASLTTTTLNASTYAFFFNQRGLMGGIGLQGSKITRIQPPR
ncbi:MAG: twin-arginine translocation pathway signal protein [Verrucomicrobiaceae bacterium]|nr:MAG: twin-arginine translocation pathway signal protein [Verrucomicrobiaceae bacterium]